MAYSSRFVDALLFAEGLHHHQTRKGSSLPYISHLMSVAALVAEFGGEEDLVIAGLLHDAVEDQGGQSTAQHIASRFGTQVLQRVIDCSDTDQEPKPPWRPRKEAFLARLESLPPESLLIIAADKLHNLRTLVQDVRALGPSVWKRFSGGQDGTLWYYRATLETLEQCWPHPILQPFRDELERLTSLVEGSP